MVKEVIRERTITDDDTVVATDNTSPSGATIFERIVYILGGILLTLLGIRVLLSLLGANRENAFADFIYGTTHPFVQPFFGLFNYEIEYGQARFEIETIVAIAFYALVFWLLGRLAGLGRPRREV